MSARSWFLASVLVYAVVVGWAWSALPEGPVPLHFGADGTPDRFGSRDEALVSLGAGLGGWFWPALGGYLALMLGWSVHMHTARYRPPEEV